VEVESVLDHGKQVLYFGTDRMKAPEVIVDTKPNTAFFFAALITAWVSILLSVIALVVGLCWGLSARWDSRVQYGVCGVSWLMLVGSATCSIVAVTYPVVRSVYPGVPMAFTEHRDEMLRYGVCKVSVPVAHTPGELESPKPYERSADPAKHIVLQRVEHMSRVHFLSDFRAAVGKAPEREALVFVHGYNVTFEDAARRTAKLVHDMQFPGVAALYSWPANGTTLAYTWDEQSVATAVEHLSSFLEALAQEGGLKAIHLIAHSMGSRCATQAVLKGLQLDKCRLDQFILAAPDIDAVEFKGIAPGLVKKVGRLTMYASSNDKALRLSHAVHEYPRAGDAGAGIVVLDGLESIDASLIDTDFLGHSYYGSNPRLIQDLKLVIEERLPASAK
jgi:esterase/lipase superfamily enzyme